MKQNQSQIAAAPNRVVWRFSRLALMVAMLLIALFAQATSIFGQNLADRVDPGGRKNTAVIFPDDISTRPTLLTETELEVTIPGRVVDGDVVVSAPTGTSNGVPLR